jgi:group I intron endonuclease
VFNAYLIVNTENGKKYIGVTTRAIAARWRQHIHQSKKSLNTKLARAIRKYGGSAFSISHIASAVSHDALFDLEKILIEQFDSFRNGYNATTGGDGGTPGYRHSEEAKKSISIAKVGRPATPEHRVAISRGRTGMTLSASHRASIAAAGKRMFEAGEGKALLSRATKIRVENAKANRAAGITAKPKGDLSPSVTRLGRAAVRSLDARIKMRKSRLAFISANGVAMSGKISAKCAGEIKWLLENSNWQQTKIAPLYGIGFTQVSNISTGRSWRGIFPVVPQRG